MTQPDENAPMTGIYRVPLAVLRSDLTGQLAAVLAQWIKPPEQARVRAAEFVDRVLPASLVAENVLVELTAPLAVGTADGARFTYLGEPTDDDNLLQIDTDGRPSRMSLELLEHVEKPSTTGDLADVIFSVSVRHAGQDARLQVVAVDAVGLNVRENYEALKAELVSRGMAPGSIGLLDLPQQSDRESLHDKCRNGDVEILVGGVEDLIGFVPRANVVAVHRAPGWTELDPATDTGLA